jgi:hypothetical protein
MAAYSANSKVPNDTSSTKGEGWQQKPCSATMFSSQVSVGSRKEIGWSPCDQAYPSARIQLIQHIFMFSKFMYVIKKIRTIHIRIATKNVCIL